MRKSFWLGTAGAGIALVSSVSALALAGDGREIRETADERVQVAPIVAREKGPVLSRGAQGPTLATYFAQTPTVPPEGGGVVQEIRCPRRAGEAISGGANTSIGIDLSYLSKSRPNGDVEARSYFVGVDDSSASNMAGADAIIEVVCAKGIAVR